VPTRRRTCDSVAQSAPLGRDAVVRMGVDAATVQRILRHSSISLKTGTYVEVIERVQRDAVSGMDSLLTPRRVRDAAEPVGSTVVKMSSIGLGTLPERLPKHL
jgi:hypothetical protein